MVSVPQKINLLKVGRSKHKMYHFATWSQDIPVWSSLGRVESGESGLRRGI